MPWYSRANNFGDLLGPLIVNEILAINGSKPVEPTDLTEAQGSRKLLSVGSVLHFAEDGDVVWGSGRNGKIASAEHHARDLDVRMVRGPLTRDFLTAHGVGCPSLFGDPALLIPRLFGSRISGWSRNQRDVTIIPNLNDVPISNHKGQLLMPTADLWHVIQRIYESRLVITSSLHGLILAEVFGIEARLVRTRHEPMFKYEDYVFGSGRTELLASETIEEALRASSMPPPKFDADAMIQAFPLDCFA